MEEPKDLGHPSIVAQAYSSRPKTGVKPLVEQDGKVLGSSLAVFKHHLEIQQSRESLDWRSFSSQEQIQSHVGILEQKEQELVHMKAQVDKNISQFKVKKNPTLCYFGFGVSNEIFKNDMEAS